MATALSVIKGALRYINSYQSGETIAQADQQDCLDTLNNMLESWSTDKNYVYGTNETILQWNAGQNQYKVGNPTCTSIGENPFAGILIQNLNIVTGVTIPSDLTIGATVTDSQNLLPSNTTVTAFGGGSVMLSNNANGNSQGLDTLTYTIPGDFAIPRPLRITGGFTRINELDFWLDVYATQEEYTSILYKAQPGPWPVIAWYNNQFPYGILNVYQTPGQSAELHLFTDTILADLTINQTLQLPQGYERALKWCLAVELWPQYWGAAPLPQSIAKQADESMKMVKALNASPPARARYDRVLVRGNRPDGGWIVHGGFNS